MLTLPTLAQLLSKSGNGSVSPGSPARPTRGHLYSCAALGLQPGLVGEVPLLISLLNLPGVQPSVHFIQPLGTEIYEEK